MSGHAIYIYIYIFNLQSFTFIHCGFCRERTCIILYIYIVIPLVYKNIHIYKLAGITFTIVTRYTNVKLDIHFIQGTCLSGYLQ